VQQAQGRVQPTLQMWWQRGDPSRRSRSAAEITSAELRHHRWLAPSTRYYQFDRGVVKAKRQAAALIAVSHNVRLVHDLMLVIARVNFQVLDLPW
jgi:hypothetical protein